MVPSFPAWKNQRGLLKSPPSPVESDPGGLVCAGQRPTSSWTRWHRGGPRAPRRSPSVPPAGGFPGCPAPFRLVALQVRAAERHGGALGWRLRCLRRGAGRASPPLRPGLCGRSDGLRGDGRYHPRGADQVSTGRYRGLREIPSLPRRGSELCFTHPTSTPGAHSFVFSPQWQREAGFLDLRARLRGDDVPGCWPGVGQLAAPRGKASHQRPWWHRGLGTP